MSNGPGIGFGLRLTIRWPRRFTFPIQYPATLDISNTSASAYALGIAQQVKVKLWQGNFIAVDLAAERGLFENDSRRIDGKAPRYCCTIVNQHAVLVDPRTRRPAGGGRILTNVPILLADGDRVALA